MEDQAENLSVPVIGFHPVQIDSEGGGIQKMRSGEGRHDFTRNSLRNDFSKKGENCLSWGHSVRPHVPPVFEMKLECSGLL